MIRTRRLRAFFAPLRHLLGTAARYRHLWAVMVSWLPNTRACRERVTELVKWTRHAQVRRRLKNLLQEFATAA